MSRIAGIASSFSRYPFDVLFTNDSEGLWLPEIG